MLQYTKATILKTTALDEVITVAKVAQGSELPHHRVEKTWANGTGYFDKARGDERVHATTFSTFVDDTGRRGICGKGILVAERYVCDDTVLIGHNFNKSNAGDVYFTADCLNEILTAIFDTVRKEDTSHDTND